MIHAKICLYAYHKEMSKGFPVKIYLSDGKTKKKKYIHLKIYLGKQLQLNRDILMELTGHSRSNVHSIYERRILRRG